MANFLLFPVELMEQLFRALVLLVLMMSYNLLSKDAINIVYTTKDTINIVY